ncbi:MAG: DUF4349 domain-containing protein [Solirubrobacteraceae bacterium]|nr:DUF4349 domain-containing protein [Patulibacter sp.]
MIRSRSTHAGALDEAPLDPAIAAELAALDAALAGETIEDDALAQLVRDVQAQAPEMPGDLRKRLRHEVAEGFPGRRGPRRSTPGDRRRIWLRGSGIAVAGLATAVVITFVLSSPPKQSLTLDGSPRVSASGTDTAASGAPSGSSEADASTSAATAGEPAPVERMSSERGAARTTDQAATSAPSSGSATDAAARKVERSVDLAIRVKSGKLGDAVTRVGQIARTDGGYVATSQSSQETRGAGVASFTLRVATAKLDQAVGSLSALGTVIHQNQDSTDITSSFDSVQQRLKDATAVRAALLRALGKATTAGEIASLKTRIADNRTTRASLGRQLAALSRRADLTTITLSLSAPSSGAAAAIDDDGSWSIGDAARDAGYILSTVIGGLIVFAGAALPFAVLALLAWPVYRARRRRSREAALGA